MFSDCPHCQTRVVPKKDGTCPACRGRIGPDTTPKTSSAPATGALAPAELALLRMLYAGVQVHVNPDGPGPRARIAALLERFRRGEVTFEFDGRTIAFANLTSAVQARFAIEPIAAAMDRYWARMR